MGLIPSWGTKVLYIESPHCFPYSILLLQSTLPPTWITSVTLSLPHFSLQFSFFPSHELFTGMLYLFFFFSHHLPYTHCISVAKEKNTIQVVDLTQCGLSYATVKSSSMMSVLSFLPLGWWELCSQSSSVRILGWQESLPFGTYMTAMAREDSVVGCVPALKDLCLEVKYIESAHLILAKSI